VVADDGGGPVQFVVAEAGDGAARVGDRAHVAGQVVVHLGGLRGGTAPAADDHVVAVGGGVAVAGGGPVRDGVARTGGHGQYSTRFAVEMGGGAVRAAGAPVADGGGPPVQGVIAEAADGAARVLGPEHVAHRVVADLGGAGLGGGPALGHLDRP